jgi:hypothetical protein
MKSIHAMKILAKVQLYLALVSSFLFFLPALYGFAFIIPIIFIILLWWFGLRLTYGYYNISKGIWEDLALLKFWGGSLVFNLPGALILMYTLIFRDHSFLDFFSYFLSYFSDWFWIMSLLGSVIAIIAMQIANQIKADLEPSD